MHYYQHHINDFSGGTKNFTRLERWLYRDMIEMYYDKEQPLPVDFDLLCDALGVRGDEESDAVSRILRRKFTLTESGYQHGRCNEDISAYHRAAEIARANGSKGGRPRKEPSQETGQEPKITQPVSNGLGLGTQQEPDGNPDETGSKANHKPITNNQGNTPIPPKGGNQEPKKSRAAFTLKTYLQECKDQNLPPIPNDDSVFEYAADAGITEDILALQWSEFRARYLLDGAKKYKAWRTVFGKSVRNNWFRLWYFDTEGQCQLTTAGIQARNLAAARKEAA